MCACPRSSNGSGRPPCSPVKTPGNHAYSPQLCRFEEAATEASRSVDENGTLPYKPRQLSAMARFDRGRLIWAGTGPFWAGQHHRTSSQFRADCSSGRLPSQRRTTREADLSTQQTGAQAPSRLPRPSRHRRRPQGARRAPRAGPQASERLSRAALRTLLMDRLRQRADFLAVANGARANSSAFTLQGRRRDDPGPGPGRLHRHQEERHRHRAQPHPPPASRTGEAARRHIHATAP